MFSFGSRASQQGYKENPSTPTSAPEQASPAQVTLCGQVIEYVQNRLYLAAYAAPPNENTPFPYACTPSHSPSKRSSKHRASRQSAPGPKVHPPCYFTIDDDLPYNRFYADFGPLHIGHLFRFSCTLNWLLADPNNKDRAVVLWSKPDARSRANAACLLACYMVMSQGWPPHMALAPVAQAEPPFMPFRDAGYSQADFIITIQDVLYGIWKAKELGLCTLEGFDLEEYERFERVDQGDFNWLTPFFIALASPQSEITDTIPQDSELYASLPSTAEEAERTGNISEPFRNVLSHFTHRNVGLVVRLNSKLYSSSYFNALGISHLDMIFDDGTVPPLTMVKKFIRITHDMILNKKKAIAVHCKAGLGRTGCLMGAYLIYRYGFTANEVIAFMRFMRPGMVVGPQQHWLHVHQGDFREWWYEDKIKAKLAAALPATPPKGIRKSHMTNGQTATPPHGGSHSVKRHALGEINHNETNVGHSTVDENLPAPTPGQPRKTSRMDARHHPYARMAANALETTAEIDDPNDQLVGATSTARETGENTNKDEEWELRLSARRQKSSHSSSISNEKKRSVSYTTMTTTTSTRTARYSAQENEDELVNGLASDVENWTTYPHQSDNGAEKPVSASRPRMVKASSRSGSGSGIIGVAKMRGSPVRRSGESRETKGVTGVRKTSGRIGSIGTTAAASRPSRQS